jgi:hypothetical protein
MPQILTLTSMLRLKHTEGGLGKVQAGGGQKEFPGGANAARD